MSQAPIIQSPSSDKDSEKSAKFPAKLGKNLKKIKRRVSRVFHHVGSPKHHALDTTDSVLTTITTAPPSNIIHIFPHPSPHHPSSSRRDGSSKSDEADRSDRTSSDESITFSEVSSRSSITSTSDMSMEESRPMKHLTPESSNPPPVFEAQREDQPLSFSGPTFTTLPSVYVELEAPDPFLIDDEDSSSGEGSQELPPAPTSSSQQTITPSQEVSLATPTSPSAPQPSTPHTIPLLPSNINKDVPPPPSSDSDPEEDEAPDLYLPGLVIPTMFLPIPNTDPLTTLLTKYIYPPEKRPVRDVTGDWQHSDFHTLVMSNSWRALARMARDRIVTSDPEDLSLVLGLWYLRLSCLARLRLFNQTSAECTNLFAVLNAIEPPAAKAWVFDRILPFELEVMQARLKYWAGDHMGYLDSLSMLLQRCKSGARAAKGDAATVSMWKERGARICLITASQLMEMKDFTAAVHLLEPLCEQGDGVSTAAMRSSVGRIYLQSGNTSMAVKHFAAVAADPEADKGTKDMNAALLASAEGDWTQASDNLRAILREDADNFVAVNNLSVALLSQGKLKEGIEILEGALKSSPFSVVVAEPFLFNLSTLYELRSTTAAENKRNLLIEVAKWSGDGLKTTCLKMPSN
ncbi:hypothetical protein BDZ94DRAFT_1295975, partial [Collybia nuda]